MKSQSLETLNKVQTLLIDFANKEGINLADSFGTPEEFKQFVISFTIRALVQMGLEVSEAYDMAMGQGSYEELAGNVWDSLQK
jgi:hypothetical protein